MGRADTTRRRAMGFGAGEVAVRDRAAAKNEVVHTSIQLSCMLASRQERSEPSQLLTTDRVRLVLAQIPYIVRRAFAFYRAYASGFG